MNLRKGLISVCVMCVTLSAVAQDDQKPSDLYDWNTTPEETFDAEKNATVKYYVCDVECKEDCPSCECACCEYGELSEPTIGCAWITMGLGHSVPESTLHPGHLMILSSEPSSAMFTPQSLRFVQEYSVQSVSSEKTSGNVPRYVYFVKKSGLTVRFRFDDSSSIGYPDMGPQISLSDRLYMVDSAGYATTTDPAYYDLYPGDGERFRFIAAPVSPDYLQLSSYRTFTGREEDLSSRGYEIIRDQDDLIKQVMGPSRFADVSVSNDAMYSVSLYKTTDVESSKDTNGYYVIKGTAVPLQVWSILNPDTNTINSLRVTRQTGTKTDNWDYSYSEASHEWRLVSGGGLKVEAEDRVYDDSEENWWLTRTVWDSQTNVVSKGIRKFHEYSWGSVEVERVSDPEGVALTNRFTYYQTGSAQGLRESSQDPDGAWRKYIYDSNKRVIIKLISWGDAAYGASASQVMAEYYSYASHDLNDSPLSNDHRPRTVERKLLGNTVAKTYYVYATNAMRQLTKIEEKTVSPGASYGDAGSLRTVTTYYGTNTSNAQVGRLKSIESPDGRLETYYYEYGTYHASISAPETGWFEVDPNGDDWRKSVVYGTTNNAAGVAYRTTKQVTVRDRHSQNVMDETYVYTGGTNYERIAWTVRVFDDYNHPVSRYDSRAGHLEAAWGSNCCGKDSQIDELGIQTTYDYDLLGKLMTETKKGTNSPLDDIVTRYTRDVLGRGLSELVVNTNSGLSLLVSSNTYDSAGRIAGATDSTGITTTYGYELAGRTTIEERAGITNRMERYLDRSIKCVMKNGQAEQYYCYGSNTDGTRWTIVYSGPDGTNSVMWTKTTFDMLRRRVREELPGYGGAILTNLYVYNSRGLLAEETRSGSASTLYHYDQLGERTMQALDIDLDDVIDLAGPDRVTGSEVFYEKDASNRWWQVRMSTLYPQSGSSAVLTNAVSKIRLTGTGGTNSLLSESIQIDINGNQDVSRATVDRDNRILVETADHADSTNDAVRVSVNGLLLSSGSRLGTEPVLYSYDGLERLVSVEDPRSGTSIAHYNSLGQVDYVEDAETNRTSYVYDPVTGFTVAVSNALGLVTRYLYSAEGNLLRTWGNVPYPVSYSYDDFDRLTGMSTYRGGTNWTSVTWPASPGAADTTQWLFDQATGLLTNKLYADGNGPLYSYTADGKLAARTWARGVVTTYSYDPGSGSVTNISYSDSTPEVSFSYNRLGLDLSISDALGMRVFSYSDQLNLESETMAEQAQTNLISRFYDNLGRQNRFELQSGASTLSVNHGYGNLGRLNSIVATNFNTEVVDVLYGHADHSGYVTSCINSPEGVLSPLSFTRTYDDSRGLVWQMQNRFGTNIISGFTCEHDLLGRRDSVICEKIAIVSTNLFSYNTRNELSAADMGTNEYSYVYDPIGNRLSHSDSAGAWTYHANELNQYTNIADGVTNSPTYDQDGNMLTYNGWQFTWNGENRLVSATNGSTAVEFEYDYMGRRFSKTVDGLQTRYLYDGWNLVEASSSVQTNRYVWGLDLFDTIYGAGGVGGLLAVIQETVSTSGVWYAFNDANGNITEYVDGNGNIAAHYEYGPFGQTIAGSGYRAGDFNFRFSSKQLDETGLYYHGYRYYHPETGRWLSTDPIEDVGGVNLYVYVQNSPVASFDPFGLKEATANSFLYYDPTDPITGSHAAAGSKVASVWLDIKPENLCSGSGKVLLVYKLKQEAADYGSRDFGRDVRNAGAVVVDRRAVGVFERTNAKEAQLLNTPILEESDTSWYSWTAGDETTVDWDAKDLTIYTDGELWLMQMGSAGGQSRTVHRRNFNNQGHYTGQAGINLVHEYTLSYNCSCGKLVGAPAFSAKEKFALVDNKGRVTGQYDGYGSFFDRENYRSGFYDNYRAARSSRSNAQ